MRMQTLILPPPHVANRLNKEDKARREKRRAPQFPNYPPPEYEPPYRRQPAAKKEEPEQDDGAIVLDL